MVSVAARDAPPPVRRRDHLAWLLPVGVTIGVVMLIEAIGRAGLLPIFVPAPSAVLDEIVKAPRMVTGNVMPTLTHATTGYFVTMAITTLAGLLSAAVGALRGPIYNLGVALHAVPIIATAPLLALWLGTGPSLQVAIAALACQFVMLVSMMQGLNAADARQRELFHALSASRWRTFRSLLLPAAAPYLFAGFKIAAPSAVLGAVTAEWAGADRGVGAMMLYALFSYDVAKVWLSVLLTCLLAAGAYAFWAALERRVVFWTDGTEVG